jgi:hypothetical protein
MQFRNLQQQVGERVEVYYERLLNLTNYLQVKANNVFLNTIFKTCLQPYLILVRQIWQEIPLSNINKLH